MRLIQLGVALGHFNNTQTDDEIKMLLQIIHGKYLGVRS